MAIVYENALKQKISGQRATYIDTNTMLYALSTPDWALARRQSRSPPRHPGWPRVEIKPR